MRIESGPAPERVRRAAIFTVILLVGCAWFAYDGWVAWPAQNRHEFAEQFPSRPDPASISVDGRVRESLLRDQGGKASAAELESQLGPAHLTTELEMRWFGPGGSIVVPKSGGPAQFRSAKRTETDLMLQRAIAIALAVAFAISAVRLLSLRSVRYVLDDQGLTMPRAGTIAWDAMQRLDGEKVDEKGWVDLHHTAGAEKRVTRLDSFEIASFGEFIDAICEKKGFENPLPVRSGG